MTLPTHLNDREMQKFVDIAPGETAVRVTGENFSGSFTFSGLRVGGRVTEVTLTPGVWTALPASPLSQRNAINIQNSSAEEIKINYSPSVVGYKGVLIGAGSERSYDITDNIILYAMPISSVVTINVEEIA